MDRCERKEEEQRMLIILHLEIAKEEELQEQTNR